MESTKPRAIDAAMPELERFDECRVVLGGRTLMAHRTGALVWPSESLLVIADMHLEKGSAMAERGRFLPPYDTRTTLGRLREVIGLYDPQRVVALGDSLHDRRGGERLGKDELAALAALRQGRDWYWITGNHDPEVPAMLGGVVASWLKIAGLTFRHEPAAGPECNEIAGHLHPAARLSRFGMTLRRPCFVSNGQRLILPAFGAYAGGLNVLGDAFGLVFRDSGLQVWMLGQDGVYPVAARQLQDD